MSYGGGRTTGKEGRKGSDPGKEKPRRANHTGAKGERVADYQPFPARALRAINATKRAASKR